MSSLINKGRTAVTACIHINASEFDKRLQTLITIIKDSSARTVITTL
jgi:hypothetical protein